MAILKILKDGDPLLRKVSREVDTISPRIITLLDDMKNTLDKANGVGLAAPQVGVLRRVVIIEVEEGQLYEMINPVIISRSEEEQHELEGCLSVPGKWGVTCRPKTVTVRAMNRKGEYYELTGTDFLARAICHETDHLDGILYTDKAERMLSPDEVEEIS